MARPLPGNELVPAGKTSMSCALMCTYAGAKRSLGTARGLGLAGGDGRGCVEPGRTEAPDLDKLFQSSSYSTNDAKSASEA